MKKLQSSLWDDSLSLGVQDIDKQHYQLLVIMEEYFDMCRQGIQEKEVIAVHNYLYDYIKYHFTEEEEVQKLYAYPDYEKHKLLHQKYTRMILSLESLIRREGVTTKNVMTLNKIIFNWLYTHIKREDKKIALYLNS